MARYPHDHWSNRPALHPVPVWHCHRLYPLSVRFTAISPLPSGMRHNIFVVSSTYDIVRRIPFCCPDSANLHWSPSNKGSVDKRRVRNGTHRTVFKIDDRGWCTGGFRKDNLFTVRLCIGVGKKRHPVYQRSSSMARRYFSAPCLVSKCKLPKPPRRKHKPVSAIERSLPVRF